MKNSSDKKDKKKDLLKAAAKVFSKKGFLDASIKDITEEAGVAVGTFYSYFKNKDDALEQIYDEISALSLKLAQDASREKAGDSIVKKFTAALTCAVCTFAENRELSKILLVKSMGTSVIFEKKRWQLLDHTRQFLLDVLEHLSREHAVRIPQIEGSSVMLAYSVFGAIIYWLEDSLPCGLPDLIFTSCTYHLRALSVSFTDEEIRRYIHQTMQAQYKNLMHPEEKVQPEEKANGKH